MYWVTGILGLILAVAPWAFGYNDNMVALWTSLIVGAATIIVSIIEGAQADRQQWEYWAAGILGLVAIFAPFVFGFGNYANAMWSTVILGVLIAVFAGSRAFSTGRT
jgi:bacteriorhodopsin